MFPLKVAFFAQGNDVFREGNEAFGQLNDVFREGNEAFV